MHYASTMRLTLFTITASSSKIVWLQAHVEQWEELRQTAETIPDFRTTKIFRS